MKDFSEVIIQSRKKLLTDLPFLPRKKSDEEGGCGVVGFAASVPVRGKHIFEPSIQMHNRGNGKGGGIAAAGMSAEQLGVDWEILTNDYILQIALLDGGAENEVERESIAPFLKIHHRYKIKPAGDYRDVGLETKPPEVVRYFVRVKDESLDKFINRNNLRDLERRKAEDEFIYQNSFKLNNKFYASLGHKRAFVLSHARNLIILKIVGYAEEVVKYYNMEDFRARVWIAHQRYPTKGRVWHPGGAHPFIGLNEALVHNGDFANYYSVAEYLRQQNITPLFLTDTEVSVLLFDLWHRVYGYPLEYVIEALAPTTELDFDKLPAEKQKIYRAIQTLHLRGAPDGPWFFIIARSEPERGVYQLLGITDTSMLRPQVFALQEGEVSIGLVASEKQAIDATLYSLANEDSRFRKVADKYWNARGGSHTDGGAFLFTVQENNGPTKLTCVDKFGKKVMVTETSEPTLGRWSDEKVLRSFELSLPSWQSDAVKSARCNFDEMKKIIRRLDYTGVRSIIKKLENYALTSDTNLLWAVELLTLLNDLRYDCGTIRRSVLLETVRDALDRILDSISPIADDEASLFKRVDWRTRNKIRSPKKDELILVICAQGFPPEGGECAARLMVDAYKLGWHRFIVYGIRGHRFIGCGFGSSTAGIRIDVYGSSGDYLASGIGSMEIYVHGSAQDQLAQIMKSGRLVVYGDVGQTFMYGAKGGEVYVMGNAAGRPLINAVGKPRVVINGVCLDFLAESFMAGDPLNGGGFVVLNGIEFDEKGRVRSQDTPYPGSNLFSLASGGAIYVRDPYHKLVEDQLNGGEFAELTDEDWRLILPYLKTNEELFGISLENDLLTVYGQKRHPCEVYRKIRPVKLAVLTKVEVPE